MSRMSLVILTAAASLIGALAYADPPPMTKSIQDGVYTEEQAGRGMQIITAQCAKCHTENLRGGPGVPSLVGPAFAFKWNGKSLLDLFNSIRTTMPPGQAGSLAEQEYADVIATILQKNSFPASAATELSADAQALADIQIKRVKP